MRKPYYISENILTEEQLKTETNPLKLIKWHCRYNCCAGDEKEWKECQNEDCPLWVMRLGKNPNRKKTVLTDEQLEARREMMKKIRKSKQNVD